jgi:adenylate cyclase
MRGVRTLLNRLIAIADEPGDDDDLRLRKRMGVVGGYVSVVAPLTFPGIRPGPASIVLGFGLAILTVVNLTALARSRRFGRYVAVLIISGTAFTLIGDVLNGGVAAAGTGMVWLFMGPAYAILALGPRRAIPWFVLSLAGILGVALVDPIVRANVPPPPYPVQLAFFVVSLGLPLTVIFLMLRYTDLRRREAQQRSDELLYNAIPISIAARLKHGEQRIAEVYPDTTVLFADIASFTPWAQGNDAARVVDVLDALFTRIDRVAATCGVEKIKTIGDAYMAVAGAPDPRPDHAEAALQLAQGMLVAAGEWRAANGVELELRIGLASGKVVAGVIGQKRILFDLWGDTVNAASRMESFGIAGRIQVAPSTWKLLREGHRFEPRRVDVKGLGQMTTYLLAEA